MQFNDSNDYDGLDSLKIGKALELFPDQILECWKQAYGAEIPKYEPKAIIISGMGGSSNAAKILQGLYESDLNIPVEVFNDYGLPAWVTEETLVVANSYSGNTEETVSAIEAATKIGAKILGVATGGKIGEMIVSKIIDGAIIDPKYTNPSNYPKSGLGISFGGLAGVLAKAGVIPLTDEMLQAALVELKSIREDWNVKETASWLNGNLPILFGGKPLVGALNAGRNAMCEISRNFTQFYDFPEVNHVLIEATTKPEFIKEKSKYIFFESDFNHDRVKLRYQVTQNILKEQELDFKTYKLKGSTKLVQTLELPHYCAWVGYYLSILQDTDPGPEPWIIKLKEALSQPIH